MFTFIIVLQEISNIRERLKRGDVSDDEYQRLMANKTKPISLTSVHVSLY